MAHITPDSALEITAAKLAALDAMRSEHKFGPDLTAFYLGAPTEEIRATCEHHLNEFLGRLPVVLASSPHKGSVLAEIKSLLRQFDESDTEERERVCFNLERLMAVVDIDRSDGLLNTWLYGFDPEKLSQ